MVQCRALFTMKVLKTEALPGVGTGVGLEGVECCEWSERFEDWPSAEFCYQSFEHSLEFG